MKKKTRPNPNHWEAVEQNVDHPHKFKVVNQATGQDDGSRWRTREFAQLHANFKNAE